MDRFHNDFFREHARRNPGIADKILSVYKHQNTDIPSIIYSMTYWLDVENPELIPPDYFTDPAVMTQYQVDRIKAHMERFEDDFIPYLFPWFGTAVVQSALGCEIVFKSNSDPAIRGPAIEDVSAISTLKRPDYYKDELMPRVLETIDFMRENTILPVAVTDPQGPLTIALGICGVQNLFIWMCTHPDEVHQLMQFCTDVLIDWVKIQKEHAGQELNSGAWPHGIYLPEGFGGVWLADDDCTQISAEMYKEFVVPYNAQVFKAFGGGTLHFCGSARHQIDNFLETEGLTGINNFCIGDFEQIYEMQEKFEDKLGLMVCDFAPLEVSSYYSELFKNLRIKGTILASYTSAEYALHNGRYEITRRNTGEVAEEIYHAFKDHELDINTRR